MTADIAWLMITANAVIAIITIANSWGLAWYAKKPKNRQAKQKKKEIPQQPRKARSRRRAALYGLNFALSVLTLIYSTLHPNPDLNLQILQIALSVGLAVLAVTFSLIGPLVESSREHADALIRVIELVAKLAEAVPKKSPNPTVESDARQDSTRSSP